MTDDHILIINTTSCIIVYGMTPAKQLRVDLIDFSWQISRGHRFNPLHTRKFNFIARFNAGKYAGNRWTFLEKVASFGQLIYSLTNPILFLAINTPSVAMCRQFSVILLLF